MVGETTRGEYAPDVSQLRSPSNCPRSAARFGTERLANAVAMALIALTAPTSSEYVFQDTLSREPNLFPGYQVCFSAS